MKAAKNKLIFLYPFGIAQTATKKVKTRKILKLEWQLINELQRKILPG
ncbi:hypothetical protein H6F32_06970 [Anabaena sp. FACHB-1237]|nr:hypothetical protein [Anabaena sp. FACHB-1237]MBD2137331.1 hypothetical protein [Anabaena sp. FACHB-1237]